MNDKSRPEAALETSAKKSTTSIPPRGTDEMPRIEARSGGILRVNRGRDVEATCADCGAEFSSTGPAASHARSARHRVEVIYRSDFTFAPIELLDGVK